MRYPILLTAACILGPTPAQTFVVDAAGGPGSSYTSIAAAVAAVPDGSVLLVQPGTYDSFTIDGKSLAVLGQAGVVVADLTTTITVQNLGPSQAVTLHALELLSGLSPALILGQNDQGEVVVQDCLLRPGPGGSLGGRLHASGCARLRVVGSEFVTISGPAVELVNTSASLTTTVCTAGVFANPGIRLQDSAVSIADCTITGGGVSDYGAAIAFWGGVCSARVLGANTLLTVLVLGNAPAVSGFGTLRVDPGVQSITGTPQPFAAGVGVTTQPMPVVVATTGPLGSTANGQILLPAGSVGGLFVGFSQASQSSPLFADPVFVDAGSAVALASGLAGAPIAGSYLVPNQPAVRGMRVAWQGFSFDSPYGFQASNAVVVAHW